MDRSSRSSIVTLPLHIGQRRRVYSLWYLKIIVYILWSSWTLSPSPCHFHNIFGKSSRDRNHGRLSSTSYSHLATQLTVCLSVTDRWSKYSFYAIAYRFQPPKHHQLPLLQQEKRGTIIQQLIEIIRRVTKWLPGSTNRTVSLLFIEMYHKLAG